MAQNSKIEWTDHTVNLWWGCQKVHTGCKNCYAEALSKRFGENVWGPNSKRRRIKSAFTDLDRYQRQAQKANKMVRVFVGSMMDIFEAERELSNPVPYYDTTTDLRDELFSRITLGKYDNIIFLFLTKRPENIRPNLPFKWAGRSNVWFGTSVSNMPTIKYADELRNVPHPNLFISLEPQIGEVYGLSLERIRWVIQGGESGPNRRPFNTYWAETMKRTCERLNIPYFFKQIDKVREIPPDLMVRQFPEFA